MKTALLLIVGSALAGLAHAFHSAPRRVGATVGHRLFCAAGDDSEMVKAEVVLGEDTPVDKPLQLTGNWDKSPHQVLLEIARKKAGKQLDEIEAQTGRPVSVSELADMFGEGHNAEFVTNIVFGHTMNKGNHFLDY